jgi:ribosomal protein L11 methyltransferase
MNYYKVSFPILGKDKDPDIYIALLASIGFESFEEPENEIVAYIPENLFSKDSLLEIDYIMRCDQNKVLNIEFIPDKNWNEVWESNYDFVLIDNSCMVRAPFHDKADVDYDIVIKPKMAFGTAHHETTEMMLRLILNHDFEGKQVLDMGCGSGVLAILASMKGAKNITAIDIDIWSYENTLENSEINNVTNINVIQGGADFIPANINYDVIFANINKNILLSDMKMYSDSLLEGGQIYFSGFYADDLEDISNMASKYGLRFDTKIAMNNWVAAIFSKSDIK